MNHHEREGDFFWSQWKQVWNSAKSYIVPDDALARQEVVGLSISNKEQGCPPSKRARRDPSPRDLGANLLEHFQGSDDPSDEIKFKETPAQDSDEDVVMVAHVRNKP